MTFINTLTSNQPWFPQEVSQWSRLCEKQQLNTKLFYSTHLSRTWPRITGKHHSWRHIPNRVLLLLFLSCFLILHCLLWQFSSPYLGKSQQSQEQRYPLLPVCAVFSRVRVRTIIIMATTWIFHVRADVEACNCARGLYGRRKRVRTASCLWKKNPSPHGGFEPASVLRLAF